MPNPLERLITRLQADKEKLDYEFKVELPKAIGVAREHGDLSENAEYHAARERHAFVRAQLGQIGAQLERLRSIDLRQVPRDRIGLYARVKVFDLDTDKEHEYRIVTSEEADFDKGLLSIESPIGRGFLGKQEGDEVSVSVPSGTRTFEVLSLVTLHEQDDTDDA